ncbi:MAG: uroporphyrinogen-III synthase [Planctomycetes bacterium]|nr:uroporphyrinogen-III synthase [Planctomycetota bacterium]
MKRILMTGPVERLAEWGDAARAAGWEPIELPLLAIEELGLRPEALFAADARFDWLLVTSRSALPFVERLARCAPPRVERAACVGEVATARVRELGYAVPLRAARDAADLAALVVERAEPGARVLWPRGDRATELATALRARGLVVTDPVVYASRERALASVQTAEAVFFASPSACNAWIAARGPCGGPGLAVAIGDSTFDALQRLDPAPFARVIRLGEPTPAALTVALAHAEP